ncbi:MAG: hypothetical protein ACLFQK_00345 [Fibrobacterota bacterium]
MASFIKSRQKTAAALKTAAHKFLNILPVFLTVMAGFSLVVTYIPQEFIQQNIGQGSGLRGVLSAMVLGSVSVMPGFAAFPLCAAFRLEGVPYYIIAAFSLSLMNIGIVTFPIEKKFIGTKAALFRNLAALPVCLLVVIIVKLVFGE